MAVKVLFKHGLGAVCVSARVNTLLDVFEKWLQHLQEGLSDLLDEAFRVLLLAQIEFFVSEVVLGNPFVFEAVQHLEQELLLRQLGQSKRISETTVNI